MFINKAQRWDTRSGQHARGSYLMLMTVRDLATLPIEVRAAHALSGHMWPIRCLVRYVQLDQLGHFMMGTVTLFGHKLSVSGEFGHDSLTLDVPNDVYLRGVELPDYLYQGWAHERSGFHEELRTWALANLSALRGRRGTPTPT